MPTCDERFWSKVNKTEACWLWTAGTGGRYGQFQFNKRRWLAHRYAYETLVGPVPEGLELDHLCRQSLCVRPGHLEPVTHRENIRRGLAARTHCPKGHPYNQANTVMHHGARECRACHHERDRARWPQRRDRENPRRRERARANYPGGATLKAAIDGLVDHGVIPDDTQDYLSVVTVLAPLGDDGPRVVLEITADDSSACPSCHAAWEDADHAACDRLLAEDDAR